MKNNTQSSLLKIAALATALIFLHGAAHAVEFSISGQVSRLIMNIDNGVDQGVVHADNSISGTRWRIKGDGELDNGMMTGFIFENQLQSNPSALIDADSLDSDGTNGNVGPGNLFSVRLANVWFKGNFGKVTIGQGRGASDGSTEADLSDTQIIQYPGASNDLLGLMVYGNSDVLVIDVRDNFDGLGRNDNIRYDAALGPIGLAASTGNGNRVELGLRYRLENFKVALGLWNENDSGLGVKGQAISASWLADNGFNISAALSGDEGEGGKDPRNAYLKLGYKKGNHAFAIDLSETRDLGPADAGSYSIGWVGLVMQGVELYVTYRVEKLDEDGADDIMALAGGTRIKF